MLRLESMELSGFKSFSDRTRVEFPGGITAVVGPNGCGKSNLGDAINWVLGEQSAKMLRGAQMADVIFGGSRGRKPLGLAEVTLVFGGAEGLPHQDQGRITVTRRLFRSGDSEYLINGTRTRLRDIQELLRQGRVGARTYATIEQGKVDQVLNAKPKERRALIEDAAGISGYKHKRRLAELKLEATHANLLRVHDIIVEVQRQINSLKRQAAKARRYRRLREELREKELARFAHQARALDEALAACREEESRARDSESEAAAQLARLEAELLRDRGQSEHAEQDLKTRSERLHQLDLEIDRDEARIRGCRERIAEERARGGQHDEEAERLGQQRGEASEGCQRQERALDECRARLEELERQLGQRGTEQQEAERALADVRGEVETRRERQFESMSTGSELRNRFKAGELSLSRVRAQRDRLAEQHTAEHAELQRAKRTLGGVRAELERLAHEIANRRQGLEQVEVELSSARRDHTEAQDELAQARALEKSTLARLATLEDLEHRFAGVSDGVTSLLRRGHDTGIRTHGVVADYVEASPDVEGAAEGYLGWLLPAVLLEDEGDARRAAELLRSQGAARTSLLCRSGSQDHSANGRSEVPEAILRDPRVKGRLRDRLKIKSAANGAVEGRIGDALLVQDLESALALHRSFAGVDYLTERGEVVYTSGLISAGGARAGDRGLLAHRRRTVEARSECDKASTRSSTAAGRVAELRRGCEGSESRIDERRRELEQAERRSVGLELQAQQMRDDIERVDRRSTLLAEEFEAVEQELCSLEQERRQLVGQIDGHDESDRRLQHELSDGLTRVESREEQVRSTLTRVTEVRTELAGERQRFEASKLERQRAADRVNELDQRCRQAQAESGACAERVNESEAVIESTQKELGSRVSERSSLAQALQRLEQELEETRRTLTRREEGLRGERSDLEQRRERSRQAELARTQAESERRHLDDLCRQELGVPASETTAATDEAPAMTPEDLETLASQVQELKEKIERLGPVNMTAIEEFSDFEERFEFLSGQREDLEKSMESLRDTIRRVNRESRQRFTETFERVRRSYQEVYQLLFKGGRADLRLEEGEDVLECGIEILAQPPGKRLSGVHLLSGGEKALSALALLFAIFQCQPSPFCLLDEVDAPLDDTNVTRFARMLTEYAKKTQFIIVTHNKLSMEVADLLYGVTMQEPGVSKVMSMSLR